MPDPAAGVRPDLRVLERALRGGPLGSPDLPHLRAAGLEGAVRARLPADHPLRADLRAGALALGARHALIRSELRDLLSAWAAEGIGALLFKGFALSEFGYATRTERFYGDVDLLLPGDPATVSRAAHLALARGWRSDGQHAHPDRWTHETMHLFSPGGHARLDVHRWLVPDWYAGRRRTVTVTRQVWAAARPHDWDGLRVWRPDPLDELVAALAISRSWGGDTGGLKPADLLDLRQLRDRYALNTPDGAAQLAARAADLGAAHTWAAFEQLCDPTQPTLDPARTGPVLARALRRDGLRPALRRHWLRAQRAAFLLPGVPQATADVLSAMHAVRRGGDPRAHLNRWTPPGPTRTLDPARLDRAVTNARLLTRALHPRQKSAGVCVPRAYATYRALRRLGHPAVFVSGAARHGTQITGHAWVEDTRGILEIYGEDHNRRAFRVLFTYPPESDTGTPDQPGSVP
ncbi:lasso peptide biosynthesis B2 protein [Deinococcus sp.]|uniref:lasso peptide biosynthesis B2 protein n=1 Tax=Deinococcus sp. TaxID=47478 RepID=UPI0025B7CBF0|nr:lasso peptide biosynthesis B2 protein [Deinococcus sp.]